jgi:anaerobic ribonucleoside-triphosphate reductase
MIRRLFWLVMGITIGVLVVRKLTRAVEKLTPRAMAGGIGAGLSDLADSIRDFARDVREAMNEREAQLRDSTGMDGTLGKVPAEGSDAA